MYSQNVMDMKDMRQTQLRNEIGNISGNLADAETNIDKTRAEERIGTGVETGVDILKTVHDAYSLKNVLSDHVKKGQEFAQKVSKQVGNQVAEQASPEPVQATPQPAEQPQSTPQSTPIEEPQPTGTQSGAQGTVEGSESAGQDVGESTAAPVSSEVGNDSEKSGSRLARYAGISEETAGKVATGFGVVTDLAAGGADIAQDLHGGFKKMDTMSKIGNIGDMVGDVTSIAGVIPGLEPLALVGEGIKLLSGLFSTAGDAQKEAEEKKAEEQKVAKAKAAAAAQKASAQAQLSDSQAASAPTSQGLIAAPVQTIQQRISGQ
jgi:hypothetical protein